jgi:5-methylcytosine-specific restriction protein A
MPRDYRSAEATEYRKLYKTSGWRKRRAQQLFDQPLCEFCMAKGIVKQADVADHIEPHRGDLDKFFNGKLQSLCATPCHAITKQRMEAGGYSCEADEFGWPIDPNHPANRKR